MLCGYVILIYSDEPRGRSLNELKLAKERRRASIEKGVCDEAMNKL